jgi:predicted MFS family arabinose efflux permease
MKQSFATVWLLAAINAIAMSAIPMMMLIGSIIGSQLAPDQGWATLPIAVMVVGTACGVIPATRSMQRLGRKKTFIGFMLIGAAGCALAGQALSWQSFPLFCLGAAIIGVTNAALQQIRFAAMESVPLASGPAAASIIMAAGIIAAFVGPELGLLGKQLSAVDYQGSYWMAAACFIIAGVLFLLYLPTTPHNPPPAGQSRPLAVMLQNPTLLLAIASGASAFVVMTFVMTATPISMHLHHGHSLEDTKWVIQSHITAMYLPSLLTVWLFKALSIRGLMIAGLVCYVATITIGLLDASIMGFWGQLIMLGIGWNFLFISGTALLPTAYCEGEQYRAQSLNDSVVFSAQAMASLSAGWAISTMGWSNMLLLCLAPVLLMSALLVWHRKPI